MTNITWQNNTAPEQDTKKQDYWGKKKRFGITALILLIGLALFIFVI